ncbi:hypothetical protein C0416_04230 [bacterium]|nr:hypothetical protein [bacterium]
MSELPENYERVLEEARRKRILSPVRFGCMKEKIAAVLKGESFDEFEGWTPEQAQQLQNDLDQQ